MVQHRRAFVHVRVWVAVRCRASSMKGERPRGGRRRAARVAMRGYAAGVGACDWCTALLRPWTRTRSELAPCVVWGRDRRATGKTGN
jgi:hypothetical protein